MRRTQVGRREQNEELQMRKYRSKEQSNLMLQGPLRGPKSCSLLRPENKSKARKIQKSLHQSVHVSLSDLYLTV